MTSPTFHLWMTSLIFLRRELPLSCKFRQPRTLLRARSHHPPTTPTYSPNQDVNSTTSTPMSRQTARNSSTSPYKNVRTSFKKIGVVLTVFQRVMEQRSAPPITIVANARNGTTPCCTRKMLHHVKYRRRHPRLQHQWLTLHTALLLIPKK